MLRTSRTCLRLFAVLWLFFGGIGFAQSPGASPEREAVIAQISDTHIEWKKAPEAAENLRKVVALVNARHPDAVIVTGDIGEGAAGRRRARAILSHLTAKVYFVPGNHDVWVPHGNYDVTAEGVAQWRREFGPDYYQFRIGSARFFVLDSELLGGFEPSSDGTPLPLSTKAKEESRKMLGWLEAIAVERNKANENNPVFVIQHIPLMRTEGVPEDPFFVVQAPYSDQELELLHRLGVLHLFAGHWHRAKVFAAEGITEHVAPATTRSRRPLGFALHKIAPSGEVTTTFISLSGEPFNSEAADRGPTSSHPQATEAPPAEPLAITTESLPKAALRQNYFFELQRGGGTPPWRWELIGGALPPGITLDASGRLTGATASVGDFHFTVKVTDAAQPPHAASREFLLKVVAPLTVEWKPYPRTDGNNAIRGAVLATNGTDDPFDLTFIAVAVNEIGKAFALGYQHFTLAPDSSSPQLDFGSTLPAGKYVVHVDAVAEVPSRNAIFRARLQTPEALAVTGLP